MDGPVCYTNEMEQQNLFQVCIIVLGINQNFLLDLFFREPLLDVKARFLPEILYKSDQANIITVNIVLSVDMITLYLLQHLKK